MNHNDNKDKKLPDNKPGIISLHNHNYDSFKLPLWAVKSRNAINSILGVIEVLLAFRFIFKLLGANPHSSFVAFLYSLTGIFAAPFAGIFNPFVTNGLSARSVLEPATLIAMIVYAAIAWGLVGLIRVKVNRDGF